MAGARGRWNAVVPVADRRFGSAGLRLALAVVLVFLAMGAGAFYWMTRVSPTGVDLVLADGPVEVFSPGSGAPKKVDRAVALATGTLVATRDVPRAVLHFASVTVRLAPQTKVRILKAGPLGPAGLDLGLEAGRAWVERESQWVPVCIRVGDARMRPGVGSSEYLREPLRALGWTTSIWVEDPAEKPVFRVDLGRAGLLRYGKWRMMTLPGLVDPWAAWNMHSTTKGLLQGQVLDMETAYELGRPEAFALKRVVWADKPDPRAAREEEPGASGAPAPARAEPGEEAWLPVPDYPVRRPGDRAPRIPVPRSADAPAVPEPPDGVADLPLPVEEGPRGGDGPAPGDVTWLPPEGLSTHGQEAVPAGIPDPTTGKPLLRSDRQAEEVRASIERFLGARFGMDLQKPLEVVPAPADDPDANPEGRVKTLVDQDDRWQVRVTSGLPVDEFATAAADLYAQAWLREQNLSGRPGARTFALWCAFKYALASGRRDEARTLQSQVAANRQEGREFARWRAIEEKSGERGVFESLLKPAP